MLPTHLLRVKEHRFPIKHHTYLDIDRAGWTDKLTNGYICVYPIFHVVWGLPRKVDGNGVPLCCTLGSQRWVQALGVHRKHSKLRDLSLTSNFLGWNTGSAAQEL